MVEAPEKKQGMRGKEGEGRPGALPLDPDGVPPLSTALRGGSLLYLWVGPCGFRRRRIKNPPYGSGLSLGTNKIGVWGLRPQRVQGRALAFLAQANEAGRHQASRPPSLFNPNATLRACA